MSEVIARGLKDLGFGIAWCGFWIGLGLFNFKGCSKSEVKEVKKTIERVQDKDEGAL